MHPVTTAECLLDEINQKLQKLIDQGERASAKPARAKAAKKAAPAKKTAAPKKATKKVTGR